MDEALKYVAQAMFNVLHDLQETSQLNSLKKGDLEDWQEMTKFNSQEGVFLLILQKVPSFITRSLRVKEPCSLSAKRQNGWRRERIDEDCRRISKLNHRTENFSSRVSVLIVRPHSAAVVCQQRSNNPFRGS